MSRKRKAGTKRELFINILDMWLENEITVIGEFGIRNHEEMEKDARKEYQAYMELYDSLKGE